MSSSADIVSGRGKLGHSVRGAGATRKFCLLPQPDFRLANFACLSDLSEYALHVSPTDQAAMEPLAVAQIFLVCDRAVSG